MKKRIISMILSIVMVIGMLPASVFAAEADNLRNFTKRNTYTNSTFDDVQKDDWFYENVKSVYELGLMQGKGDNKFDTESGITIAETLTIAARLHSIYYTGSDTFTASNPWYQVYADYCVANSIASVDSDNYSQAATRAEFVMILANALPVEVFEEINKVAANAIPDVTISDAYGAAVYKMYRAGIMIGNDDIGTFAPSSEIKRSEVATIVARMVDVSLRKSIQLGNEYTVTFNMNGHGKQIDPQTVVEGYTAEKPTDPTKSTYVFKGWYTQKTGGQQFDFNMPITEDITLYARWEMDPLWLALMMGWMNNQNNNSNGNQTYTVTFDANGSDVENLPAAQHVKAGECAVEPADPTKLIHDFGGWYTDSSCTNPFDFSTPITSNISLYAKWNISIYSKPLDESHVKTGILEYEGEEYEGQYVDNELLITLSSGVDKNYLKQLLLPFGAIIVGQIPTIGHYQVELPNSLTVNELNDIADEIENEPFISDVCINTVGEHQINSSIPNDLYGLYRDIYYFEDEGVWDETKTYEEFWNEYLWGHNVCNIPEAWSVVDLINPNSSVRVGVIDDSIDASNDDLNVVLGGFFDERFNPFTVANNYALSASHGTHVAGIIGAIINNEDCVSGILKNAEILAISVRNKPYEPDEEGYLMSQYAWINVTAQLIEANAKIINISLGTSAEAQTTRKYQKTIQKFSDYIEEKLLPYITGNNEKNKIYDFIITTAATNNGDVEHNSLYANGFSCCDNPLIKNRVIVVGNASNDNGRFSRSKKSSYIGGRVDVMAPGTNIYSLAPYDSEVVKSGTSMASPFVAGLAGLIWEANPNLTPKRVKEIIVSTANIDVADSDANMVNAEAAVIKALGYDPRTKDITFKFVDTATNSAIKAQLVSWHGIEYSPKYAYHPELDLNDLKLTYWELNGDENSTISTVPYTVPYGEFRFEFEAPGYQKNTVAFAVDNDTNVITINMIPDSSVTPPNPDTPDDTEGFNITGTFVYLNDANEEIPVSSAVCTLTDITNSNMIYEAVVSEGQLTSAFTMSSQSLPAGTYTLHLYGGHDLSPNDIDSRGFYSNKVIDNVVITGDLDLGKIYCDRVASVSCAVTNEDNEYLNNVGMTIAQNGTTVMGIDRFYHGFDVALKEGLYTLTLTCDGYNSFITDFSVKGTTDLGIIKMIKGVEKIVAISLDQHNSSALSENGNLYLWGANNYGQIGNNNTINQNVPYEVLNNVVSYDTASYTLVMSSPTGTTQTVAGHSAAITIDGDLYCWGHNSSGEIGNGTIEDQLTPVKVLDHVASVTLGANNSAAITKDGSLYCWGSNSYGQVGNGNSASQTIPVKVLENVKSVVVDGDSVAAITEDGS